MSNMNLSTGQAGRSGGKPSGANAGVVIGLVLLLIAAGISAFLVVKERNLIQEASSAEEAYNTAYADLMTGRNMDVIDLQSRIFKLKEIVNQRNSTLDAILNVEKYLVSGVAVKDFKYSNEEKTIKLTCIAGDYDIVARQVASFKNFEHFSDVILEDAKVNTEGGGIDFSLSIIGK